MTTAQWNGYAVVAISLTLQANCLTHVHQTPQFHPSVSTQFVAKQKVYIH